MTGPRQTKAIIITSLLTIAASLVVMMGWIFNIQVLKQIVPGFVSMVFNAALCFMLFAGALLATRFCASKYCNLVFLSLSLIGTLIGVTTLLEFQFHFNAGIDQLFISDATKVSASHLYPGRMAYNAAVDFSLLGMGFLLVRVKSQAAKLIAQYLFHAVSILSAIALIGYLYGVSLFNTLFYVSSMATHTAILFLIMSIAASLLNPSLGITRLFTGKQVGNQMARRLFSLIVVMVLAFGCLRAQTEYFKIFSLDIGISILAICFLLMSLFIIWSTANWLNRIDHRRTAAEAEVKLMNCDLERRVAERSAEILKSEAKYRSLIEQASDAIYTVDFKGYFTEVNDSICKMTGYTRDELLQMNVEQIIDPEELKTDPVKHGPRGASEYTMRERRMMRKNKTIFDAEVNVKRFPDDKILVIARDITDRKLIETELKTSEQKYKLLFDSNPLPLLMVDKDDLSIIAANDAATALYGYSKQELLEMKVTALRPQADLKLQQERFRRDLDNASKLEIAKHIKKCGTEMFIQISAHDIEFEGRRIRLSLANDITEKLKAEESLQKSEANLQTILRTTNIVFATFSKDLEILAFNPKASEFVELHYKSTLEKGQRLTDYLSAGRSSKILNYMSKVLNGKNISYEIDYRGHWYNVTLSPVINDISEILGVLMTLEEITERKNAEQNLRNAYGRIQSQINSIKDMAWKQSHLIRSPLANLKALANILHEDPSDHMTLDHIQRELNRMDSIIIEMAEDASEHDK